MCAWSYSITLLAFMQHTCSTYVARKLSNPLFGFYYPSAQAILYLLNCFSLCLACLAKIPELACTRSSSIVTSFLSVRQFKP